MRLLSKIVFATLGSGLAVALFAASGCSGDNTNNTGSQGTSVGGGGSSNTNSGGNGGIDIGPNDGGLDPDAACAAQSAEATLTKRPVDIIFIVDNSGSMTLEITSVQNNINVNFASIIQASGIDYRVIMIADHGSAVNGQSICIDPPLSNASCNPLPAQPGQNPPIFYHYSREIASHDSLCRALDTYNGALPDDYGIAPNGWQEWLRPEALKVFVEITDDGVACSTTQQAQNVSLNDGDSVAGGATAAAAFENALFALQPAHFGDANQRNYVFYSIVGMTENMPPDLPYGPMDPVLATLCNTAADPGTGYQHLSVITGGLRYPICQTASYDAIFQAIAAGVISGAVLQCEFPVPMAPPGQTIDLSTVIVQYTPGVGSPQLFTQVPSVAECGPGKFYIENNIIKLCQQACTVVQADNAAKLDILYGCENITQ